MLRVIYRINGVFQLVQRLQYIQKIHFCISLAARRKFSNNINTNKLKIIMFNLLHILLRCCASPRNFEKFVKGSSSLLFIIPVIKSFHCKTLLCWRLFMTQLVVVSFLCNANDFAPNYLFWDYLTIFLVQCSYINNLSINSPLFALLIGEYYTTQSIEYTKDLSFVISITKSIIYIWYIDKMQCYMLLYSVFFAITTYKVRYYLHTLPTPFCYDFYFAKFRFCYAFDPAKFRNNKYDLALTYAFHISITSILYILSQDFSESKT